MKCIDSHAHLDHEDLAAEVPVLLDRARAAGVMQVVTVASNLESSRRSIRLAETHHQLFATVGVHPHDADDGACADLAEVELLLDHERVVALGETGLDYHYDFSPRDRQRELFIRSVEMARRRRRPLVIHLREAHDDAMGILHEIFGAGPAPGVVHCFTGTMPEAREYLELGLHLSFSGIATFPRAEEIQRVAAWAPAERILVETDSPYLAPVPCRGRRNEPALVVHTIDAVARLRGVPPDELGHLTASNTRALFGLKLMTEADEPPGPASPGDRPRPPSAPDST